MRVFRFRLSRRHPPCRRPASNQPSHATPVCRLVTRLSPLPLPRSTSCTTPPSDLLQLVRPPRRRRRLLLCSCRHPPCRRPASTQPSHATSMRRLVTRLSLLLLQGCTARPPSTPRACATTPGHASDAVDQGVLLGPGASTSGAILERISYQQRTTLQLEPLPQSPVCIPSLLSLHRRQRMAPRPKPLPLLPRHPAAATRSSIDLRTSSASTRCVLSCCSVTAALNTLPELWLGGTLNLPSRRRPGQGVKVHPSWWVSHHHAVQGLFTMTGRHRVVRRLSTVYWGTTLNCILPTPSVLKSLCDRKREHRLNTSSRRLVTVVS